MLKNYKITNLYELEVGVDLYESDESEEEILVEESDLEEDDLEETEDTDDIDSIDQIIGYEESFLEDTIVEEELDSTTEEIHWVEESFIDGPNGPIIIKKSTSVAFLD